MPSFFDESVGCGGGGGGGKGDDDSDCTGEGGGVGGTVGISTDAFFRRSMILSLYASLSSFTSFRPSLNEFCKYNFSTVTISTSLTLSPSD